MRIRFVMAALLGAAAVYAQAPANHDHFYMGEHPTITAGNWLKLELRPRVDARAGGFGAVLEDDEHHVDARRIRAGVSGTLFGTWEFRFDRELRTTENTWRDVWLNIPIRKHFEVRAGHMRTPITQEWIRSMLQNPFIFRSRGGDNLGMGRETGVVLHGDFYRDGVFGYSAGVFRRDGTQVRHPNGNLLGRFEARPLRLVKAPAVLRDLYIATAAVRGRAESEGLPARSVMGDYFFAGPPARGTRWRHAAEIEWQAGPLFTRAEVIRQTDARRGLGPGGGDLPALMNLGWQWSGEYVLTGERKSRVSVALRRDTLDLDGGGVQPFNRIDGWTGALVWRPNAFLQFQFNLLREGLKERNGVDASRTGRWMPFIQIQVAM